MGDARERKRVQCWDCLQGDPAHDKIEPAPPGVVFESQALEFGRNRPCDRPTTERTRQRQTCSPGGRMCGSKRRRRRRRTTERRDEGQLHQPKHDPNNPVVACIVSPRSLTGRRLGAAGRGNPERRGSCAQADQAERQARDQVIAEQRDEPAEGQVCRISRPWLGGLIHARLLCRVLLQLTDKAADRAGASVCPELGEADHRKQQ